jgi:hypothetical protein
LARLSDMTVDEVLNFEEDRSPTEVRIENKPNFEQLSLISQLDEEDKQRVFKIIDTMHTKEKSKDFF